MKLASNISIKGSIIVELSILKLVLSHEQWLSTTASGFTSELVPDKLQPVFSVVQNHFEHSQESLSVADLANLFFASYHKDKDFYEGVFENLVTLEVSDDTSRVLLSSLVKSKKLKELSLAAYEAHEGKLSPDKFQAILDSFNALPQDGSIIAEDEGLFISDDIEFIVEEAFKTPGLRWRLDTMNKMLGSLRPGDFGFVFARPETGKTTFLVSELTYMAEQATSPILWLANEEDGKKVMMRVYQAAFGIDLPTLLHDLPSWKKKYDQLFGGRLRMVSRMDYMTKSGVQKLCDKVGPSLIVIDQLSKIGGFESDRKDLELGAACEWGRRLAKTYAPVVAVHQADGTAEGQKWLNMNHVSNAKTAMQADADWILGIGKSNAEGYESLRYLALSKNKLTGDSDTKPEWRHGKREVLIEPMVARYKDLF